MGVTFIAPQGTYTAPAKLVAKEITENGTYDATDDSANGYSSVTVNVEGGGGETWQTVFEGSVTTVMSVDFALADITDLESLSGDSIKVTFNGTEYILPKVADGYGAMTQDEMPDFSEYPLFIVTLEQPYTIYTETAGTYTLKIEEPQSGGESDFSTAEVRVVNNSGNNVLGGLVAIIDTPTPMVSVQTGFFINMDMTVEVPLYKGMCMWVVNDPNVAISVTGNITNDGGMLTITGDCTITIS